MTDAKPSAPAPDDCCGHKARREANIDAALAESFPASDPPTFAQASPKHEVEMKPGCGGDKRTA